MTSDPRLSLALAGWYRPARSTLPSQQFHRSEDI